MPDVLPYVSCPHPSCKNDLGAGGLALLRNGFTLVNMSLSNNVGFFGGGLFLGANLTTGASLSNIAFENNTAILGETSAELPACPIASGPERNTVTRGLWFCSLKTCIMVLLALSLGQSKA